MEGTYSAEGASFPTPRNMKNTASWSSSSFRFTPHTQRAQFSVTSTAPVTAVPVSGAADATRRTCLEAEHPPQLQLPRSSFSGEYDGGRSSGAAPRPAVLSVSDMMTGGGGVISAKTLSVAEMNAAPNRGYSKGSAAFGNGIDESGTVNGVRTSAFASPFSGGGAPRFGGGGDSAFERGSITRQFGHMNKLFKDSNNNAVGDIGLSHRSFNVSSSSVSATAVSAGADDRGSPGNVGNNASLYASYYEQLSNRGVYPYSRGVSGCQGAAAATSEFVHGNSDNVITNSSPISASFTPSLRSNSGNPAVAFERFNARRAADSASPAYSTSSTGRAYPANTGAPSSVSSFSARNPAADFTTAATISASDGGNGVGNNLSSRFTTISTITAGGSAVGTEKGSGEGTGIGGRESRGGGSPNSGSSYDASTDQDGIVISDRAYEGKNGSVEWEDGQRVGRPSQGAAAEVGAASDGEEQGWGNGWGGGGRGNKGNNRRKIEIHNGLTNGSSSANGSVTDAMDIDDEQGQQTPGALGRGRLANGEVVVLDHDCGGRGRFSDDAGDATDDDKISEIADEYGDFSDEQASPSRKQVGGTFSAPLGQEQRGVPRDLVDETHGPRWHSAHFGSLSASDYAKVDDIEYGRDENGVDVSKSINEEIRKAAARRTIMGLQAEARAIRAGTHPLMLSRLATAEKEHQARVRTINLYADRKHEFAKRILEEEVKRINDQHQEALEQRRVYLSADVRKKIKMLAQGGNHAGSRDESHRMLTRHTRGAGSEPIEHISLDRIPGMGRASASSKIGAVENKNPKGFQKLSSDDILADLNLLRVESEMSSGNKGKRGRVDDEAGAASDGTENESSKGRTTDGFVLGGAGRRTSRRRGIRERRPTPGACDSSEDDGSDGDNAEDDDDDGDDDGDEGDTGPSINVKKGDYKHSVFQNAKNADGDRTSVRTAPNTARGRVATGGTATATETDSNDGIIDLSEHASVSNSVSRGPAGHKAGCDDLNGPTQSVARTKTAGVSGGVRRYGCRGRGQRGNRGRNGTLSRTSAQGAAGGTGSTESAPRKRAADDDMDSDVSRGCGSGSEAADSDERCATASAGTAGASRNDRGATAAGTGNVVARSGGGGCEGIRGGRGTAAADGRSSASPRKGISGSSGGPRNAARAGKPRARSIPQDVGEDGDDEESSSSGGGVDDGEAGEERDDTGCVGAGGRGTGGGPRRDGGGSCRAKRPRIGS